MKRLPLLSDDDYGRLTAGLRAVESACLHPQTPPESDIGKRALKTEAVMTKSLLQYIVTHTVDE